MPQAVNREAKRTPTPSSPDAVLELVDRNPMADERKITAFVEVRADDPTRGRLFVTCPFNGGQCSFSVWQQPAQGIMWHWSGPADKPTISPSISCEGGCQRHFTIIDGVGT